ncbi:ABC transporter permease subunit [Paenibacillus sp. LMG 31461]|uniref:ABC transporter permease subunit n=1 Tax=Paenibacillus plantarum TaxID=2654975 RepID=A0ABX1X2J5_9BACL|nr:ABC transporter permease subunit [Paenibacillus plantarum]NOU62466.1 ABC transporter permease subunit [Paenibacillus plantarum]
MQYEVQLERAAVKRSGLLNKITKDYKKNYRLYLLVLPVILFYLIFSYIPMYGVLMAFQNYSPGKGILGSKWIGLDNFQMFFQSAYFGRVLWNTLKISFYSLLFDFPAPIIFALLLNELKWLKGKNIVQTITYMPHFISIVVVCGMIKSFTMDTGVINYIVSFFGGTPATMLSDPSLFVPIYVISDIWQNVGWSSIIFIAAISTIDPSFYEASEMDGANRFHQIIHITIPSLIPTIVILLILRLGSMLNVGFEKIILLYNPGIYSTSDVISTFVFRRGLVELNWGFSAAVGLFNSVINFILVVGANYISRKTNENSLW